MLAHGLFAQSNRENFESKNTFYAEFVGEAATPFSIHYDRIINLYNLSFISVNAGFGYFPVRDEHIKYLLGIPVSISWNLGKKRNFLELGGGFTYNYGFAAKVIYPPGSRKEEDVTIKSSVLGNFRIGYKYQNPSGGFFFKLGFTPFYELIELTGSEIDYSQYAFFGIGLGYSF